MRNLKNNLSNSNNDSINRTPYLKAISLASLSSLVMTLAVNDIYKANATIGRPQSPKVFYGSSGQRTISGVHTGNSGVKPVINPGKITTTPKGNVVTNHPDTSVQRSLSNSGIAPSKSVSTQTQSSKGIGSTSSNIKVSTGTSTSPTTKIYKDKATQTPKNLYNGSVFHGDLDIETASTSSKASSVKSTGSGSIVSGSFKSTATEDVDGVKTQSNKLSKKQKLAIGAGVAGGLATLGLGLGLGLGLNNDNNTDDNNTVTPPDLIPVPEQPPIYSTLITQSSDGNLFIDEKVDN